MVSIQRAGHYSGENHGCHVGRLWLGLSCVSVFHAAAESKTLGEGLSGSLALPARRLHRVTYLVLLKRLVTFLLRGAFNHGEARESTNDLRDCETF